MGKCQSKSTKDAGAIFRSPSQWPGTSHYTQSQVRVTRKLREWNDTDTRCKMMNNYMFIRPLGRGSQCQVFLVLETVRDRLFAGKIVPRSRLTQTEQEVLQWIRHPNIVTLYEIIDDSAADCVVLIMEYMTKGPVVNIRLEDGKTREGPLEEALVSVLLGDIVRALCYLHEHGVHHGDIKPDNILRSEACVKLADFGGAYVTGKASSPSHYTPAFVAPEGNTGAMSDVWSVGIVAYVLLAGFVPEVRQGGQPLALPEGLSAVARSFLEVTLAIDSKDRYSAEALSAHPFVKGTNSQCDFVQEFLVGT